MGKIFEIDSKDEFEFMGMVYVFGTDGKKHLCVDYKKEYGDKYTLKIEAYATGEEMRAAERITYGNFRRRYPKHRIYGQGYVEVGENAESI